MDGPIKRKKNSANSVPSRTGGLGQKPTIEESERFRNVLWEKGYTIPSCGGQSGPALNGRQRR